MVKRRPESTGGKQVTGRELTQFKPGQSGNPKGRPQGSRNKLSEEFFADLCEAWQRFRQASADDSGVDASCRVRARGCIADTERARGHRHRDAERMS